MGIWYDRSNTVDSRHPLSPTEETPNLACSELAERDDSAAVRRFLFALRTTLPKF